MKLGHKQRQLFEHAFLCGLNAAGTITRAQVDEAMQRAINSFEQPVTWYMGDTTKYLLELFEARKVLKRQDAIKIVGSISQVDNALVRLKERGLINKIALGLWQLTPNGDGRPINALGGLNERV